MDPYPILLWLERNSGAVSSGTDVSYCEAPQGTVPQPSTGESYGVCSIIPAMLPT